MIRDVRTVLRWLAPRERWPWLGLVPLVSIGALIEAGGALATFGLLRLVVEPEQVRTAPVVSQLWRAWPTDDPRAVVATLALGVGVFYLVRALFLSWVEWVRQGVIFTSSSTAAERLLARYLAADYRFHVRRRSASLIEPMTRASDIAFELVAGSAVNILAEGVTIAALALVLYSAAPPITLVAVAIVLAVVLGPIVLTRRSWERIGDSERVLLQQQLHVLLQSLGAIKDVKVSGRQPYFEEQFRHVKRELSRVKQRRSWAASAARHGVETTLVLSMLLVVFLVMRESASGSDTVSVLALFAYTGFRVIPSANRIMLNVGYLREAHPWVANMDDDLRRLRVPAPPPFSPAPPLLLQAITCEELSFRYEDDRPLALDRVSLTIRRGQSVGIVGATGAGKSTLVDVLLGLLTPTSGRVVIDGLPLEGRERDRQRQIGYVSQDVYLLDDSLRRNIAFGIPDGAIDEHRLTAAIALARLDEVVAVLPRKLETVIGEGGVRLSGGQRQRVAIARALYHDPPVLFFDEATAALDNQTEREVTEAIAAVHGTRTVIAIAHRLSTVKACDQLIYLKDGHVRSGSTSCRTAADSDGRPCAGRIRARRTTVVTMSAMGSAKIKRGTPAASAVAPFCQPAMAVVASRKPISRLPLSPRKIEARKVEHQESHGRPHEGCEHHRLRRVAAHDQDRATGGAGEHGDSRRQAVDAIDQVKGIGQPDTATPPSLGTDWA